MNVFLLLHRCATAIGRIEQLSRKLVDHALFATCAAIRNQPPDSERRAALGVDLDRHLVVRSTDTPGLHFQRRLHVLDSLLEQLQSFVAALRLEVRHRLIEDALGSRLLAAPHHAVDELGDQRGAVNRVRSYFALRNKTFTWHSLLLPPAR